MPDTYYSLTIDLPEAEAELLQSGLHDRTALGLEVRDREAPPMPGVRGPAEGEAIVVAYFGSAQEAQHTLSWVEAAFPRARAAVEGMAQQDWSESWKGLIKSTTVGRLWVGPPWDAANAPADKVRVVIEPKMAFGTGDHPTTALCLAAVDAFMNEHPGASVLDVGTGTGVLAIAARKLGAGEVVGTDNDPTSVTLARENAQDNGTPEVMLSGMSLTHPTLAGRRFDLVLANILANTLVELAPQIAPKVGRALFLAGVLAHQAEEVETAYRAQGLHPTGRSQDGNWVRLDLVR